MPVDLIFVDLSSSCSYRVLQASNIVDLSSTCRSTVDLIHCRPVIQLQLAMSGLLQTSYIVDLSSSCSQLRVDYCRPHLFLEVSSSRNCQGNIRFKTSVQFRPKLHTIAHYQLIKRCKTFEVLFNVQDLFLPGGFELANYNNSNCDVKTATGNVILANIHTVHIVLQYVFLCV